MEAPANATGQEPARTSKGRNRRAILQAAVLAGAAAGGAGLLAGGKPALAGNLVLDIENTAAARTRIKSSNQDNATKAVAFEVENTGANTKAIAIRGVVKAATKDVSDETAIVGISGNGGDGIYGHSTDSAGVTGESDTGVGVHAIASGNSTALVVDGRTLLRGSLVGRSASLSLLPTTETVVVNTQMPKSGLVVAAPAFPTTVFATNLTDTGTRAAITGALLSETAPALSAPAASAGVYGLGKLPGTVGVLAESTGGDALSVQGTSTFTGNATFNGQVVTSGAGSKFVGNGLGLSALNASFLTTGTIPDARLSANVPLKNAASNAFTGALTAASLAGSGAGITGLNASNLATGTVPDARLSANVALKDGTSNTFEFGITAASFTGSGGGITGLNAANITTGVLDPARIPGLDASKITSGRFADARIGRNIPRRNAKLVPFSGVVTAATFGGKRSGPPVFTSVGTATVAAGKSEVAVKFGGVGTKAHVLPFLQSDAGAGVGVLRIEKVKGGFKAVLTGPATKAATLAFFVVGQP